jgi:hypothetical protein
MEIFGGFMVMMSILSFFMAVAWLIMPFVVFAIKGKLDKTLDVLAEVEKRLALMEAKLEARQPQQCDTIAKSDEEPAAATTLS